MARTATRLTIAGVPISNPDKVLYPAAGFTKADAVRYYVTISRFILPHLEDRPVTLKRYPDGVGRPFFYEKNAPTFTPDWVPIVPGPRAHGGPDIRYVVIRDRRTSARVALFVKDVMDGLRLRCFAKVSGSKGILMYPSNSGFRMTPPRRCRGVERTPHGRATPPNGEQPHEGR